MQAADQRHCLDVYAALVNDGCADEGVLTAALIHDAGKGRIAGARFGIAHRVAYVLLEPFPPALHAAARVSSGMASLLRHSQRTIEIAREYGASEDVLRLLGAMEHSPPANERAARLKAADDRS
jgi:hypothetical protein